jgi:hypothetical protein
MSGIQCHKAYMAGKRRNARIERHKRVNRHQLSVKYSMLHDAKGMVAPM